MRIKMYQVDAFTEKIFGRNPAAVCILDKWMDQTIMQKIAAENNLPETAEDPTMRNLNKHILK